LAGSSLDDIAAAEDGERTLKVSKETSCKKLAGSIKYVISVAGSPPTALAGGSSAVNQAVKAIAIARADLNTSEDEPMDILVQPTFDGGSVRCALEMTRCRPISDEMETEDFLVKGGSDPYKVAGAIAGRLREGERIGILAKGDDAVFKTVESIAVSRRYMEDEKVDIKFAPRFVDLEGDDGVKSTYVHFAVLGRKPRGRAGGRR
jgi:stage V sporulation protein SpoVS